MKIVIPMTGIGKRFMAAGYRLPKPLIEVEGKPIIEHVVNMFPGEKDFIFVCNEKHLKETNMRSILERIAPGCTIVEYRKTKGPVDAVLYVEDMLGDDEPVIVNYCDFYATWDYEDFKKTMEETGCDGCVPCYTGFHPHLVHPNVYAGVKIDANNYMTEIKEKTSFTEDKTKGYHSSGTYYFKKGAYIKKYFREIMSSPAHEINGEFYVSTVYEFLLRDKLRCYMYPHAEFLQWGTPEDFEEYLYWSNIFRGKMHKLSVLDETIKRDLQILVPMAGEGSRFKKEGYKQVKPLIEVSGKPMVVQAVDDLPRANKIVFMIRKEHINEYGIDRKIKEHFPNSKIIVVDKLTEGQACTCMLGEKEIDPEKPLLIAPCDNGLMWNLNKFRDIYFNNKIDSAIWTFRGNATLKANPKAWGWVKIDNKNNVLGVSCKVPISDDPINDHAIIATFYFRKAKDFFNYTRRMIEKNIRINNEFYVDTVPNELVEDKLNVKVFEVDKYIGWGTPNDLKTYLYWRDFFDKAEFHPYKKEEDEDSK